MFVSTVLDLEELPADPVDRAAALLKVRNRIDAEIVTALGSIDTQTAIVMATGLSPREWVSRTGHVSPRSARRLTDVAAAIRNRFPAEVVERLAAGEVSVDHLEVLVRCSNERIEPTWSEQAPAILDLADDMTFPQWARLVRRLAKRVDADGAFDPNADLERNRLHLKRRGNSLRVEGEFFGEMADVIEHAVAGVGRSVWERFWEDQKNNDLPMPPSTTITALALYELVRNGNLANPSGRPRAGATEASFIIQLDTAAPRGPVPRIFSRDGRELHLQEVGRLLCDPTLRTVVLDSLGRPLDVGSAVRLATDDMRAALAARDGGCVFPGCCADAVPFDAHHVKHWIDGGPTAVENLVQLCRRHHTIIHQAGWAAGITNDGWAVFRRPDGIAMWGQRHGVQRRGPIPDLPGLGATACECGVGIPHDHPDRNPPEGLIILIDRIKDERDRRRAGRRTHALWIGRGDTARRASSKHHHPPGHTRREVTPRE